MDYFQKRPGHWDIGISFGNSQGPSAAKRHGLDPAGKESTAYIPPDLDLSCSELLGKR